MEAAQAACSSGLGQAPAQVFPGVEGHEVSRRQLQHLGNRGRAALEGHGPGVEGQAVEARPVLGGEGLQPVKGALLLEDGGVAFQGVGGVEGQ